MKRVREEGRYKILGEIRSNEPVSQEAIYEEARRVRARQAQARIVIPAPNFLQAYQFNGFFAGQQPVELYVNENSRNEMNRQEIKHIDSKKGGIPLSPASLAHLRGKFREAEVKLDEKADKTSSESSSDNGLYISDTSSESSFDL